MELWKGRMKKAVSDSHSHYLSVTFREVASQVSGHLFAPELEPDDVLGRLDDSEDHRAARRLLQVLS
jgi:hypothetical protein